jgi:dTDP-glucose 4,6-dehydratase
MNRQKLLITGSGGFILSNFIRKLIYEKMAYDIVSIDKINKSSTLNNMYSNKNHKFYIGDIADEHFVNVIFEYEKPNIILHGAAEDNINKLIASNVLGTQVLVNAAIEWNAKNFIYISGDGVYGKLDETSPTKKEIDPINPTNPYFASKAAGEFFVKAAASSFGLNYSIIRLSNNYGPRQTAEKFIPKIIKSILEEQKIPIYGQGLQIRDWLHVFDCCSAIMKILENGKPNETYNLSANQEFSNIEIVNEISKIIGKGMDLVEYVKDIPGHEFRYAIDSSKIKQLGWEPKLKLKSALPGVVDWYLMNQFFLK